MTTLFIFSSLWVLGSSPAAAAEPEPDWVVRNALDQAVRLEITNAQFSHVLEKSTIGPRWESTLASPKIGTADALTLGARVLKSSSGHQEIARCQSTLSETSRFPKIAVIIYKDSESPRCSIVDLNAFQVALKN